MDLTVLQSFEFTIETLIKRSELNNQVGISREKLSALLPVLITKYKKLMTIINPDYETLISAPTDVILLYSHIQKIYFDLGTYLSMVNSFSGIPPTDEKELKEYLCILSKNPKIQPMRKDYLWR